MSANVALPGQQKGGQQHFFLAGLYQGQTRMVRQKAEDDRQAQKAEDAAARNDMRQVYRIAGKIRADQGQIWISNIERRGQTREMGRAL